MSKEGLSKDDVIVTGDAYGVDLMARVYGRHRGISVVVKVARWKDYGLRAGPIRNQEIVDVAEKALIFWNGTSRGTYDVMQRVQKKGIPFRVVGV